ncbi:mucin-2 protein [Nocardioides sp. Kera G14]|uniref:mucin-2 protein n=1 Tax=Nocardioides sp. Kera G14 TaxID=2884264 RepID=UPI001D108C74|nr:mucin-2 protein [Nocardioides sp. Kera G14]UDY24856.1 mucin-2 protein [Nocardioides sp. Kera G14]
MSDSPRHAGRRRAPRRRRVSPLLVAAGAAVVGTLAVVGGGVALTGPMTMGAFTNAAAPVAAVAPAAQVGTAAPLPDDRLRAATLSRSLSRRAVEKSQKKQTRWTTTALNLWAGAGDDAKQLSELKEATKLLATGVTRNDREQVVVDDTIGWVTSGHLSDEKPPPEPAGISMEPCPDASVEKGLKPQTIKVYRSVCHAFPQITSYGGWAPRSEHDTGNALDVMTSDKALGDEIAAWALEHAAELDLYDVIWYDRIWTPVRASEGWRDYGDHGSATANHMDHVHIGTN